MSLEERIAASVDALVASRLERLGGGTATVEQECEHAFGGKTSKPFRAAMGKSIASQVSKMDPWQAALLVFALGIQVGRHLSKAESLDTWLLGR